MPENPVHGQNVSSTPDGLAAIAHKLIQERQEAFVLYVILEMKISTSENIHYN